MRKAFLGWYLAAAALAGCGGTAPRRPAWVDAPKPSAVIDGVGLAGYRAADPESLKKARDAAYNDAMQKLSLKLHAVVRAEVRTSLQSRLLNGREVSEQQVESLTTSVSSVILGRKQFEEFQDDRRREYWVRCWMSPEEGAAALQEARAAAERERDLRTVTVQVMSSDRGRSELAQGELAARLQEAGYVISAQEQAGLARILVTGRLETEDLGSARALGVDLGRSCRAVLDYQAVFARGLPGERQVPGRAAKDNTGIGRTTAEACAKAARKAVSFAAAYLIDQFSRPAAP